MIVLVDEYDTPTSYATQHDYFPEVSPQAKYGLYFTQHFEGQHLLPRGFLSIAQSGCAYIPRPTTPLDLKLWNNEHLRGALMVSILRVAKADWFSGVNNLKVVQYLSFIAFYLTAVYRYICWVIEPDIRRRVCLRRRKHSYYTKHRRRNCKAVDRYGMALWLSVLQTCSLLVFLQDISFAFEDLRKWFNGYNSGDGKRLYNPWSIAQALGANKLGCYWTESGRISFVLPYAFQIAFHRLRSSHYSTNPARAQI